MSTPDITPPDGHSAWMRHYEEADRRRQTGRRRKRLPASHQQRQLRLVVATGLLCLIGGLLAAFLPA